MNLELILIILLVLAVALAFCNIFKIPKCGNMTLITGGVKTGKSLLSVHMVICCWKLAVLRTRIYNFFVWLFHKFSSRFRDYKPLPLIYSNVPLGVPYVPITQALLERRERFVYGSVCYLCEASLIADSMSFKDEFTNEQLLLFVKLFAHETKGGMAFYDTQSVYDNHYAIKRCLSSYFYIHHSVKIPFFVLMFVRELKFSEDGQTVNTFEEDIEEKLKIVVVPKSTWNKYDRYCYSVLTDHLPVNDSVVDIDLQKDLKANDIITFKEDTKVFMRGGMTREEYRDYLIDKKENEEKHDLKRGKRNVKFYKKKY